MFNIAKKNQLRVALALAVLVASTSSHAAIDTATAIAGITEAGTAVLAVLGGLLAMSVSIFGLSKVYAFIKSKAGA